MLSSPTIAGVKWGRESPSVRHRRRSTWARQDAFTVLELLTTIALIVVVMGLMVSLARYVRAESADQLTRRILVEMDYALAAYYDRDGAYPSGAAIAPTVDEAQLSASLQVANQHLLAAFKNAASVAPLDGDQRSMQTLNAEMLSRDAWGRPIGYLSTQHPLVGMAPQNRPFFFSAGPDGKYLTRQDNLYSYEQARPVLLPGESRGPKPLDKANN